MTFDVDTLLDKYAFPSVEEVYAVPDGGFDHIGDNGMLLLDYVAIKIYVEQKGISPEDAYEKAAFFLSKRAEFIRGLG